MGPDRSTLRVDVSAEVARDARRTALRAHRLAHGGWAVIGIIVAFGGATFFMDPSSVSNSAIGHQLSGPVDDLWNLAWLIGGVLIAYGCLRPDRIVELAGQLLFVIAVVMYTVAIFVEAGKPPGAFLALAIAGASVLRIAYLIYYAPSSYTIERERRQHAEPFDGPDKRDG